MTAPRNAVDLAEYRVGAEGWGVFRVLCPCGRRWVAVAPGTPTTFECPRCGAHAGRAVDTATWEAAPPEDNTTMSSVQTNDSRHSLIDHLADDGDVVRDIARALYNLRHTHNAAVLGVGLADLTAGQARDVDLSFPDDASFASDAAFVRDVLAGKNDADIYERECRAAGYPIVSIEEFRAWPAGLPMCIAPPFEHMIPFARRWLTLRRAFVEGVAVDVASRDESCREHGYHWMRNGVRRGTPEA